MGRQRLFGTRRRCSVAKKFLFFRAGGFIGVKMIALAELSFWLKFGVVPAGIGAGHA